MSYPGFEGSVGRVVATSKGWWPPRPTPREGAPNIVVMLADDLGFADLGCYGSEIDTPNLDRLAGLGVRYTSFHVAPMCSPTRAALLTGVDPHRAGLGTVAHVDPGFPGYASELAPDVATIAEILRDRAGYATMAVGKWHLAKDSDGSAGGSKRSWPCQRGFDRYYGVIDAFTNLHHPHRIVEDNHQVEVDRYEDDYYFTDDITDRAISMIREQQASNPRQPFFCYFAHGAVHAPLHARPEEIAKYRGRYDAGWDRIREERFARQRELGVVPPGVELPPRNTEPGDDVPPWDELAEREQRLFARHMEVYAAMVDRIDQNVGRLVEALDDVGVRENTIFVFLSDNGASREGEGTGTTAYYVHLLQGDDVDADLARIDEIGGPTTTPHYPRGWAMASGTPFRLYKINAHQGGHSVPFIWSWPAGLPARGELRTQYQYVTGLLPTLLELVGVERPDERQGVPLTPLQGASFVSTLHDPDAPGTHREHVVENNGHRGYYREGWHAVTRHPRMEAYAKDCWELYDLTTDPTELHDLAGEQPERLAELVDAWEQAAWANRIFPLDDGTSLIYLQRPEANAAYADPIRIPRGTPTLERWRSVQLIWFRGFTVGVELEHRAGDDGMLFAHGDQGAGYACYVRDGELVFAHNDGRGGMTRVSGGSLPSGTREVVVELAAPGERRWDLSLRVDGREVATHDDLPMLFGMAPFEGIDVGIDRRSPVDWALYERFGPFPYSGSLAAVTYTPGEPAPDAPVHLMGMLRELGAKFE
ncbi:MAG: arylsulfatase [Actinobacteria bacterium]|nr:arylsulfatase [Actinomycetota bacterium]